MSEIARCPWAGTTLGYLEYHDEEWGRPVHDDSRLFEMLVLEGMQAGLSWLTILKKREAFREAFEGFDPAVVAMFDEAKIGELLGNERIIRNRSKINAAIGNAQRFLEIQDEYESFSDFIWGYVEGRTVVGHWRSSDDLPTATPLAIRISKDLRRLGFKFIGPVIVYSFLQAVGIVNDHTTDCFVYKELVGG